MMKNKNIVNLLDEYADIREVLTGELLYTLVGVDWEARAGRGFIDLYDALLKIEHRRMTRKRLTESDKLWWGMYGLFILILVLANITDLVVLHAAWILIAIVLGIFSWLKYRRGR